MELAEQRNQNISELIRDRMAGNYTVPAQTMSRDIIWNRGISVLALELGAIAFLWSMMGMMMQDISGNDRPVLSYFSVNEIGNHIPVLATKVAHLDGFSQDYEIETNEGTFQMVHRVEGEDSIYKLTINLCRVELETCVPLDRRVLILPNPSMNSRQSEAVFFEEGQSLFKVFASTPSLSKNEVLGS